MRAALYSRHSFNNASLLFLHPLNGLLMAEKLVFQDMSHLISPWKWAAHAPLATTFSPVLMMPHSRFKSYVGVSWLKPVQCWKLYEAIVLNEKILTNKKRIIMHSDHIAAQPEDASSVACTPIQVTSSDPEQVKPIIPCWQICLGRVKHWRVRRLVTAARCIGQVCIHLSQRHPVEVECMPHPRMDWLVIVYIFSFILTYS